MVAVALAMTADLDLRFQEAIADDLPAVLVNPSGELEQSGAVADDLAGVRGTEDAAVEGGGKAAAAGVTLPMYGSAPDFVDTQQWFNTPGGQPLSIAELTGEQGRVVLIDFWTYTCINCIRTLPYVTSWDREYRDDGLTIIGVHSPEFAFEKDAGNVADAIERNQIDYPVVQDNELGTWNAFAQPILARQVPDRRRRRGPLRPLRRGRLRADRGRDPLAARRGGRRNGRGRGQARRPRRADPSLRTPETYLGSERAQGWVDAAVARASRVYQAPDPARCS